MMFVHGFGVLECFKCHRLWEQENEQAKWCCGHAPIIYDEPYRKFCAWLDEHE